MKDEKTKKQSNDNEAVSNVAEEEIEEEAMSDVADKEKIIEEYENKYKRALADYQNLQKRVEEEKRDWVRAANKELLLRILPILDTLMLAQKHSDDQTVKVSVAQFLDTLKAEGVTQIKTEGEDFDPMLMEVVTTGDGEDGKVIEEMRTGYMIFDKLLRPAQVKVGKTDKS